MFCWIFFQILIMIFHIHCRAKTGDAAVKVLIEVLVGIASNHPTMQLCVTIIIYNDKYYFFAITQPVYSQQKNLSNVQKSFIPHFVEWTNYSIVPLYAE